MMFGRSIVTCLAICTIISSEVSAELDIQGWSNAAERVFDDLRSDSNPGCAIAMSRGGEILFEDAFGLANLEHEVPITTSTVFRIGSVSKQFTAASIAILNLRGKLDLDTDIRQVLKNLPDWGSTVTIRHLIHHSSGLPDVYAGLEQVLGDEDGNFYPSSLALQSIRRSNTLRFRPGEQFEYSNSGYLLLAEIVEQISGMPLAQFAHENIFQPLGMNETHFHDDYRRIVPNRAYGYGRNNAGDWETRNSNFYVVGDGGLFTTLADFAKWQSSLDENRLEGGDQRFVDLMHRTGEYEIRPARLGDRDIDYSFGLINWRIAGRRAVGHRGSWAGYRAASIRFPDESLSLMAFCNFREADSLARLFRWAEQGYSTPD